MTESQVWRCRDTPGLGHGYESLSPKRKWSNQLPCKWCGRLVLDHDRVEEARAVETVVISGYLSTPLHCPGPKREAGGVE